jgi:hypothetical protein
VVGQYRGQVAGVAGRGPALDQVPDLLFVAHGFLLNRWLSSETPGASWIHRSTP